MTPACIKLLREAGAALQHVGAGETVSDTQRDRLMELGCELSMLAVLEQQERDLREERLKV